MLASQHSSERPMKPLASISRKNGSIRCYSLYSHLHSFRNRQFILFTPFEVKEHSSFGEYPYRNSIPTRRVKGVPGTLSMVSHYIGFHEPSIFTWTTTVGAAESSPQPEAQI